MKDVEETTNPAMIPRVRRLVLAACLLVTTVGRAGAQPARTQPGARVSVQPINGELGPALRAQLARLVRAHGYRALTTLPRVGGTGQYLTLARDNRLAGFVTADIEEGKRRHSVTFLVWDGVSGSVRGRWSASGSPRALQKAVAKNFWKRLGPTFEGLQAPPSDTLDEAPPMYVNAGEPLR
jgi:hypothetical protein